MRTLLPCLLVALTTSLGCAKDAKPALDPAATVRFVVAGEGDVAPLVVAQAARSQAEHRRVLLYVSAPWCEPCRVFHEAVDRGELTGKLGALDLLAFDGDRDAERLLMSGYESQYIPAFAVPGVDGRAVGRKIEGSVKGGAAVGDLVPRLRELLADPPH